MTRSPVVLPDLFEPTGLRLPAAMPYERWADLGVLLGQIGKSHQWWIGDWVAFGERSYGEKHAQAIDATGYDYDTLNGMRWVSERVEFVRRRTNLSWSHHKDVAALEPAEQDKWLARAEKHGWGHKELRAAMKESRALAPPAPPVGKYRTVIIDPPWPIEKIEREVRPNQAAPLDYRTMSLEEIGSLSWCGGKLPTARDGAHVYLWVTQKFLPAGLDLFTRWGVNYECQLTWVKNVGFTPFSWMYSTEHVLFGRVGSLDLERKGLRLDFNGKVREHSRKPDEFYDLVAQASPGPRLDMFGREPHDGFKVWGNETDRFAA